MNECSQTNTKPLELGPVKFADLKVVNWEDIRERYAESFECASKLEVPRLRLLDANIGTCAIVGGGPTAANYTDAIKAAMPTNKVLLMGVNAMHRWLIDRDLIPQIHIIFEPDIEDLEKSLGGAPHPDVTYYIASHCPVHVFKALEQYKRVLWHAYNDVEQYQAGIAHFFPGEPMVTGGYCTFFRNISIATILGFRNLELFGVDSSFDESSHIEGYGGYHDVEDKVELYGVDPKNHQMRKFKTQGGLAYQAIEFLKYCEQNPIKPNIRVHGDGLLRYLHESRYPEQYQPKETL